MSELRVPAVDLLRRRRNAAADCRVPGFRDWLVLRLGRETLGNLSAFRRLCALERPGYLSPC